MVYRVLLQGGLGNQLFQVAAGTYLKEVLGKQIKFDATLLTKVPKKIRLRDIEVEWLLEKGELDKSSLKTLAGILLDNYSIKKITREDNLNDKILENIQAKSKIISGYFHNHEYVDKSWTKIGPKILDKIEENSRDHRKTSKYIAAHFRGGDYLNDEKTRESHGVTGLNYFIYGIKKLSRELDINKVVFVTDSPKFLKQNLGKLENLEVTISSVENIFEDLAIIAKSSGVVMSNSSFSWWGAFIANKTLDAKIIAPTPWFTGKIDEPNYLIPKHWSVLERDIF